MGRNRAQVTIDGRTIVLTGSESIEYISQVAAYIDRLLRDVRRSPSAADLDSNMLMLMTVINVADELFKERKKTEELEAAIDDLKSDAEKTSAISAEYAESRYEAERLKQEIAELNIKLSKMEISEEKRLREMAESFDAEKEKYLKENQRLMLLLNETKEKNLKRETELLNRIKNTGENQTEPVNVPGNEGNGKA